MQQQCSSDSSLFEVARSIFAIKSQISRLALPSGPAWRGRQSQQCGSHCRGNISGQILRITTPRPRHGLNYCWISRYVDNISRTAATATALTTGSAWVWVGELMLYRKLNQCLHRISPGIYHYVNPGLPPDHFFDMLIVRKTLFGALQVKKILWNYFYASPICPCTSMYL